MHHSAKLVLAFVGLAISSALPAIGQAYHQPIPPSVVAAEHDALLESHERSIYDSSVSDEDNVRPLRPPVPDANDEVLVATTSLNGNVGDLLPVGGEAFG